MACTFVHISDTHLGPDQGFSVQGMNLFDRAAVVVEEINRLPGEIDFIIHSGDVANHTDLVGEGAYKLADKLFGSLRAPIYFAAGNHDLPLRMKDELTFPDGLQFAEKTDRLVYRFEQKGVNFVVLDARIGEMAEGCLDEPQFEFVRSAAAEKKPLVIVVHYIPIDIGVEWYRGFDGSFGTDKMLVSNGERLHEILCACPAGQVRGVFFGHIHATQTYHRDGILYSGVSSTGFQFEGWPGLEGRNVHWDLETAPGYQIVRLHPSGVTVTPRKVAFPRSRSSLESVAGAAGWKKSVA